MRDEIAADASDVPDARNQLRHGSGLTTELLAELTDAELDEQIAYFRERQEWYRAHPGEVKPASPYASNSYAAYRFRNLVGAAVRERASRPSSR